MIVLIPSYEPDNRLLDLIDELTRAPGTRQIVVVDDGSGASYANIYSVARFLGCTVLTHSQNLGKGAALQTGFRYIEEQLPGHGVVCADSDGQHTVTDILRVARLVRSDNEMVLGVRQFQGRVPIKSRIGNTLTKALFRLATGRTIQDTQTGLRGYPEAMLPWLQRAPGSRFEYELNLLLRATREQILIREEQIETVYLEGNASTHFRPLADSVRIYKPLFMFMLSSFSAFLLDTAALLILNAVTTNLLAAVVLARLISATCNFVVNRNLIFSSRSTSLGRASARYAALAGVLLLANVLLISLLTGVGVPLLVAKVLTEITLVMVSYQGQQRVVFVTRGRHALVSHLPGRWNATHTNQDETVGAA